MTKIIFLSFYLCRFSIIVHSQDNIRYHFIIFYGLVFTKL